MDLISPHGRWSDKYSNYNYHNGYLHGKYETYWNESKTKLNGRGNFNMGEQIGLWEYFDNDENNYSKIFYL